MNTWQSTPKLKSGYNGLDLDLTYKCPIFICAECFFSRCHSVARHELSLVVFSICCLFFHIKFVPRICNSSAFPFCLPVLKWLSRIIRDSHIHTSRMYVNQLFNDSGCSVPVTCIAMTVKCLFPLHSLNRARECVNSCRNFVNVAMFCVCLSLDNDAVLTTLRLTDAQQKAICTWQHFHSLWKSHSR